MLKRFVFAMMVAVLPGLALAQVTKPGQHGGEPGQHGGEVADANPGPDLHLEVVLKGNTISVYLSSESGKQVPSAGVTGTATVLIDKKKEQVTLAPAGGNKLTGTGGFTPGAGLRMLVSLTIGGVKQQALFTRGAP